MHLFVITFILPNYILMTRLVKGLCLTLVIFLYKLTKINKSNLFHSVKNPKRLKNTKSTLKSLKIS